MMKKGDFLIIILAAALAVIPLLFRAVGGGNGAASGTVTVEVDGQILYEGPVRVDKVIETEDGGNRIVIRDGKVRMERADCPDQLCVKAGEAEPGKPVICLPHKVVVTVTEEGEQQIDAVIR